MSVLGVGVGGAVLRAAIGGDLLAADTSIVDPGYNGGWTGTLVGAVAGASGWWDAGVLAGIGDSAGAALGSWQTSVGRVLDKSTGARPLLGSAPGNAVPRTVGTLGGVGRVQGKEQYTINPVLDLGHGWAVTAVPMGSNVAWTRYLVWTRPNLRQQAYNGVLPSGSSSNIIASASTPILSQNNMLSGGALTLFPGTASAVVVKPGLTRRYTHSVILRHTPGTGVDVWVDNVRVATGVTHPYGALTSTVNLLTGAQCYFHEAATWERALSDPDITTLLSAANRWARGPRKGATILLIGQSNAGYFSEATTYLEAVIAYYSGILAVNVVNNFQYLAPGTGIYDGSSSYLIDPAPGTVQTNWASWATGATGLVVQGFLTGATSINPSVAQAGADPADFAGAYFYYWEADGGKPYSAKSTFKGAAREFAARLRSWSGRSVAQFPIMWVSGANYSAFSGVQTHREAVAELAAIIDGSENVVLTLPNMVGSGGRGTELADQNIHISPASNRSNAILSGVVAARAMITSGRADVISSFPAGVPVVGGPRVVSAEIEASPPGGGAARTTVLVTVQHDAGTDLVVPTTAYPGTTNPTAASGTGWVVWDGWASVTAPGAAILATACARVSATQLRVTLATAPVAANSACRLFYGHKPGVHASPTFGLTSIGERNLGIGGTVTDNLAATTPPAGWDIAADLGSIYDVDYPLQVTVFGVAMT